MFVHDLNHLVLKLFKACVPQTLLEGLKTLQQGTQVFKNHWVQNWQTHHYQ